MGYLQSIMGKNEQTLFVTRRHWTVIAGSLIGSVILSLIIIALAVALVTPSSGLSLLLLFLLVLTLGRLSVAYLKWWNEQYIVTNRRIIQIEGVFNKHVIDSSLEKVNDVVLNQSFMGRLLDYGDIEILTASEIGVNKLEKLSRPIRFKTTMLNAKESLGRDEDLHLAAQPATNEKSITALITELAGLRDKGLITEEEFQSKKKELMSRL